MEPRERINDRPSERKNESINGRTREKTRVRTNGRRRERSTREGKGSIAWLTRATYQADSSRSPGSSTGVRRVADRFPLRLRWKSPYPSRRTPPRWTPPPPRCRPFGTSRRSGRTNVSAHIRHNILLTRARRALSLFSRRRYITVFITSR